MESHGDPEKDWYAYRVVDYAAMALAAARSQYAALHEAAPFHDGSFTSWAEKRSPMHPYHYDDGVSILVADHDVNPEDDFTVRTNASPRASGTGGIDAGQGGAKPPSQPE